MIDSWDLDLYSESEDLTTSLPTKHRPTKCHITEMRYLYFVQRVVKKAHVEVGVKDSEVSVQSFQDHVRSNVHLPYEVRVSIVAGMTGTRIVRIIETLQRPTAQNFACRVSDADE